MPVSAIPTVNSGLRLSWGKGSNEKSVRLRIRHKVCYLYAGAPGSPLVQFLSQTGSNTNELPIILTNSYYYPPFITTLVRLFEFYHVHACMISIMPRVNTSNECVYTLGFASDPEWPESHGATTLGYVTANEEQIGSIDNSCTSVAYRPCVLTAAIDRKQKFFTAGPLATTQVNFSSTNAADLRQSCAGMFLISGVSTLTAAAPIADVYMHLDIELNNYTLPITTSVTMTRRGLSSSLDTGLREIKEKKIVDEDYELLRPRPLKPRT